MPDEQITTPQTTHQPGQLNINAPGATDLAGMALRTIDPMAWFKLAGQVTFGTAVLGSFLFLQYTLISQNRSDRVEDRTLFRGALKDILDQQNRHTGEIKGAMDANNAATRALTEEIRAIRHAPPGKGLVPPG
jgi:hypothetical protein